MSLIATWGKYLLPDSAPQRGSILAIGGHEERSGNMSILKHFVSLCGGPRARLVVLSTASPTPGRKEIEYGAAFRALGVADVCFFHQYERTEASDPALLTAVDNASGVFLAGGHQQRLVSVLSDTILESRLHERHNTGLHLAGTSAGAAALSAVMITRGKAYSSTRFKPLRLSPGFSFLPNVVVDQHFHERDRISRLLSVIARNPSLLGFGLDEDTAFELDASDRASVIGSGTLTVVDGSELGSADVDRAAEHAPTSFAGMRMHVLVEGWTFDLTRRRVELPIPEAYGS